VRSSITLLILLTATATAYGAQSLSTCRQIENDPDRLACYDAAVDAVLQPATQKPSAETHPTEQPQSSNDTAVSGETIFGKVDSTNTAVIHEVFGVPNVDSIESTITQARTAPDGHRVFALANGQVWAQTDSMNLPLAIGDVVHIRRGMVGSYLLSGNANKKSMRVKRVD